MRIVHKSLLNNNFSEKGIKNSFHKEKQRKYGIDILRIFSMINIINLHINLRTGLLYLNSNNSKFKEIWRLESFSYFSVDCFGLISGIVGFEKYKFSNLAYLWFISAFYCVSKHLYLYMKKKINIKSLLLSFFPILIKFHWYVNAYFIMYLFLPFINLGIKEINKKTFKYLVVFYIFFFSIYYIIGAIFKTEDYNFLLRGYSSSWLTICYIIGGFFGKYILESLDASSCIIKTIHIINYIGLSLLSSEIFFITKNKLLICYLSPTILFQAISLVMIFYSIKIKNKFLIKIIKFITPLTFSATLIHSTLFKIRINLILFLFQLIKQFNAHFFILKVYILSIIIFIFCILIDYLRLLLFKVMRIRELCFSLERLFPKLIDRILEKVIIFYFKNRKK